MARSENKLNELKKELEETYKVKVTVIAKDLTKPDSSKEIKNAGIKVDYLINIPRFGGLDKFNKRNVA